MIGSKEVESIKAAHLGSAGSKLADRKFKTQKRLGGGDKFRQVFKEDWDACEDTSVDINPLYAQRKDPRLLFGRGFVAGVDQDFQKTLSNQDGSLVKRRMDTLARNYMQSQAYLSKSREEMTERDWRIFREDNEIYIKGGQCPNPVRSWDEVEGIPDVIRQNIRRNGYHKPTAIQM